MAQPTLTKVGNSAAAFIPKAAREQADIQVGQEYDISSPRRGVVVLTFHKDETKSVAAIPYPSAAQCGDTGY